MYNTIQFNTKVKRFSCFYIFILVSCMLALAEVKPEIVGAVPDTALLRRPFDNRDADLFLKPQKCFYPETWFHFVNGNVDRDGIREDLEAIAGAGLAGVQFFHGGMGSSEWKGVKEPIYCLTDKWEDLVKYTASEARRLGLRFTMQNCPGWSMSGGPWIDMDHTMRYLKFSRTDVKGGKRVGVKLSQAAPSAPNSKDYRDLMVLALPTPMGDTGKPLYEGKVNQFEPTTPDKPNVIDVKLKEKAVARTLEFCPIDRFNHNFGVDPAVHVVVERLDADGKAQELLSTDMPRANWQDTEFGISLPLDECEASDHYRISIVNRHSMNIPYFRLYSATRQPNWEGDGGWVLRSLLHTDKPVHQPKETFVKSSEIVDITDKMTPDGTLSWEAPEGNWTILRIGHVNTEHKNGPAPQEATGWECDKFSRAAADLQFRNYVGKLTQGPLNGLVGNMLMDSWECNAQTWTANMPEEFQRVSGYPLRKWIPALFGYVLDDNETTARFLVDWRMTLNDLYVNNFFGEMSENAHRNGLTISYETAAGDVTPADAMEYYKYADVPMCEVWQPYGHFLANRNYKPIRPTASAAHMYGKPRVSAEAFTSFVLTWDEHFQMLKDVANTNLLDGMTHFVFHTYTHNPGATKFFPGTSFGSGIGSPFLRGQTWWKHMPAFTTYLARLSYMLERGVPVNSVLWYLGDEPQQKPDQYAAFPEGYRYEYCNRDALLHRMTIKDGMWTTPEGIQYPVMWIPEPGRMIPETAERLLALVKEGGVLVADVPTGIGTLDTGNDKPMRYAAAVKALWPDGKGGIRQVGQGKVIAGTGIGQALELLRMPKDVTGIGKQWLHRKTDGADWYFVTSGEDRTFSGDVCFCCKGNVEVWNPVTGMRENVATQPECEYTKLHLEMQKAGCLFVVFRHDGHKTDRVPAQKETDVLNISGNEWLVSFPSGWGIEKPLTVRELKPWCMMPLSEEGRAFSGTATYTTSFRMDAKRKAERFVLKLGKVDMVAVVRLNGKELGTLWTEPYELDVTDALKKGDNQLEIDVTSTWRNRLVYDASQPENARKTWVISGPKAGSKLKENGLMGPVKLCKKGI